MEANEIIVGLDIGTTKICAIVGRKNQFGKLEILGMGKAISEGVFRGVVNNIEKTVNSIRKAVTSAEEQSGINIGVVNVGIAGQHIKSSVHHGSIIRNSSDDEITIEDVNRLTNDMHNILIPPGSKIIHVMPQDYMVDYEEDIKDPVGHAGVRLEADFHVITAQTNAIQNITKCVERAGLEIDNLILEPLASSLSVLSDEEKEAGVCLVDIGGGTTDIAIFHENIIRHTSVIPFGGNIITTDIKDGCNVLNHQAESLKTRFGQALAEMANENEIVTIPGLRNREPKEISVKTLARIIEARMEEIIEMVHTKIITSGYENKLGGGIVITGGGAQLTSLKQLFEYMTGLDARVGYPNEHLGKSKVETSKSPMYATSVGLVLCGFRELDDRDNRDYLSESVAKGDWKQKAVGSSEGILKKIIEKTKSILIDDFEG
jgi:cell division protein FtsA